MKLSSIVALLAISSTAAFTQTSTGSSTRSSMTATALNASASSENKLSKFFAASVASAIILSSVATIPDALAYDYSSSNSNAQQHELNFGSSDIIAGRSGGRGGGRSSASSMRSAPSSSSRSAQYRSPAPTTINRTTIIAAPTPMYSAPVVIGSPMGFGYSPFGGMGYGALGAVSAINNEVRDNRQENEIRQGRTELEISKQRQAQLEQRLNQLERDQMQTSANVNAANMSR
mmetsp:Transcript_16654/g.24931  ORF Transcript_16654/g.24931 Transcript_16654/m.24931 type:complete len:232 (-) Transcript_16654:72-767(-)